MILCLSPTLNLKSRWQTMTFIGVQREITIEGVSGKKPQVTSDVMSNSPLLIEERTRQFARRIKQSIRCHLRLFSMHPFNFGLDTTRHLLNIFSF